MGKNPARECKQLLALIVARATVYQESHFLVSVVQLLIMRAKTGLQEINGVHIFAQLHADKMQICQFVDVLMIHKLSHIQREV